MKIHWSKSMKYTNFQHFYTNFQYYVEELVKNVENLYWILKISVLHTFLNIFSYYFFTQNLNCPKISTQIWKLKCSFLSVYLYTIAPIPRRPLQQILSANRSNPFNFYVNVKTTNVEGGGFGRKNSWNRKYSKRCSPLRARRQIAKEGEKAAR